MAMRTGFTFRVSTSRLAGSTASQPNAGRENGERVEREVGVRRLASRAGFLHRSMGSD